MGGCGAGTIGYRGVVGESPRPQPPPAVSFNWRREALSLYRDILRASRGFTWKTDKGEIWWVRRDRVVVCALEASTPLRGTATRIPKWTPLAAYSGAGSALVPFRRRVRTHLLVAFCGGVRGKVLAASARVEFEQARFEQVCSVSMRAHGRCCGRGCLTRVPVFSHIIRIPRSLLG